MEKAFKTLWSFTWFKVVVIATLILQTLWLSMGFIPELNMLFVCIVYGFDILYLLYRLEKEEKNPNSKVNTISFDDEEE